MPSSPSLKALELDPVTPSPHVSSLYCMGSYQKLQHIFWRPELDTVAYIYRVKQTIVHMILSRSVHQINIVANYPGLTGRLPVFLASRQFTQLL